MPLVATRGAASAQGFGEFAVTSTPTYIEDVFSTYLYTGNGSTQTITNGVDLSTKGGLVWIKSRSNTEFHRIFDTARGVNKSLSSNSTNAQNTAVNTVTAFNTTGFNLGNDSDGNGTNTNAYTYASWTFRKQPKFFDVVTYTGNGTTNNISHNLQSIPGCIIIKSTSTTGDWAVICRDSYGSMYYRYFSKNTNGLNSSGAATGPYDSTAAINSTTFDASQLQDTGGSTNQNGVSYVAYLFAHNAGGFGLTGTDNVISCGTYTGNGSTVGPTVTLGYEPQWVLIKEASASGNQWVLFDNMRGMPVGSNDNYLYPNLSAAESSAYNLIEPTATGFYPYNTLGIVNASSSIYIYIAIRRGPMKVPTLGTSVFATSTSDTVNNPEYISNFPVDMEISTNVTYGGNRNTSSRLLQGTFQHINSTNLESVGSQYDFRYMNGWATNAVHDSAYRSWMFRRAPSFFDEVCFTSDSGGGTGGNLAHNLTVEPNLMIFKARNSTADWLVTCTEFASWQYFKIYLNSTNAKTIDGTGVAISSASTFAVFNNGQLPANATCVAYLFATCAGVSKVGSYTGTGALQTVNCGFTSGARFVLIKRTDSTGDWWTYDSARGISSGNDPYLFLNDTAAQVTGTNYVDTDSTGFKVTAAAPAGLNASGGTYIFLAIAYGKIMQVRIKLTGAVMYESEFRAYTKANGGPSWETTTTEVLESLGADVVFEGPQATGGTVYQYSQASGVEQVDGKWYTKYVLGPVFTDRPATDTVPAQTALEQETAYKATKDAEQAKSVRQSRDDKLKETDWIVIKNLELNANIPGAWEVYRQALRDVPAQSGFPWTITWPVEPQ